MTLRRTSAGSNGGAELLSLRLALVVILIITATSGCLGKKCFAQSIPGRTYNQSLGLLDLDALQVAQTQSGALFVNTESRAFFFDGQRFLALGEAQGITGSTSLTYLATSRDRHMIVGSQVGRLLVAEDADRLTYQKLKFAEIRPLSAGLTNFGIMTPYADGMVVETERNFTYLDLHDPKRITVTTLPPELAAADTVLRQAVTILGNGRELWGTMPDGTICVVGASGSRCWATGDGLPREHWGGLARTASGEIVARSVYHMVWLNRAATHISRIIGLPDPSAALYGLAAASQSIVATPGGDLLTQTEHGFAILRGDRWAEFSTGSTAASATVSALFIDQVGSLWLGAFELGLIQYFNYDSTESWTAGSGLSSNVVWSVARDRDQTYVGTDAGLNVMRGGSRPLPAFESRSTQSVAIGRPGSVWLCMADGTLMHVDAQSGRSKTWSTPVASNVHVDRQGNVWLATGKGLYLTHDDETASDPVLIGESTLSVTDLSVDPDGGIWLTGNGGLWHKPVGGPLVEIVTDWHEQAVKPEIVQHTPGGPVWVGTMDGLFRVDVQGEQPLVTRIPDAVLTNPTIMAVLAHSDGSLWVGTSAGIAVERHGVWTTIDTYDGLIGADIAADGLVEDTDHSIWVATSNGLTHIVDPEAVLRPHPPVLTLLGETVNGRPYGGELLANGPSRLDLRLGVLNNPYGSRIQYRTRMVGVDPDWVVQSTGNAVYPFLPSGRHDLLVEAWDPVRRIASEALHLRVAMAEPWWRRPWAVALAMLLLAGIVWLALRWRTAYLVRQRRALAEQVSSRTRELELRTLELEEARQRLEILAQRDALTGLLNRRAVRDLFDELAARDGDGLSVALLDVDHFKRINDTHGHLGGDSVLVEIARRFERALADGEIIGRFGGEEYVVLLPGRPELAPEALRRVVREVADRPVFFGTRVIRFTVSGGIADVQSCETWEQVLSRADQALYEAKRAGRDLILEAHPAVVTT